MGREPWFPDSVLDDDQQEKALAWADSKIAQGHHSRCRTRFGHSCDCYFGRGDYLAARLLRESANSQARPE